MSQTDIMNGEHLDLIRIETYKSNYIILLGREPIEKRRESAEKLRTLYMN